MHIMEQKIHPDSDLLTKELLAPERNEGLLQESTDDIRTESAAFTELESGMRRCAFKQNDSGQDKRLRKAYSVSVGDEMEHELHRKQKPWPEEGSMDQNRDFLSPIITEIPDQVTYRRELGSIALSRSPTFGGKTKPQDSSGDTAVDRIARSDSWSSISQPRGRTQSSSNFTPSNNQPGTPGAYSRPFCSTTPLSHSEIGIKAGEEPLPSPYTFGMPIPAHSRVKRDTGCESQFFFQHVPLPLPPLNHPAFVKKASEFGVLVDIHRENKVARHSHSLPSLAETQSAVKAIRQRSKSSNEGSTAGHRSKTRPEQPKWAFPSRTSSKSSVLNSRRSSAEYSAKQASSLHSDGCWEADVSKAIISLSLGQRTENTMASTSKKADYLTITGNACGDNVGIPFLPAVTIVPHLDFFLYSC